LLGGIDQLLQAGGEFRGEASGPTGVDQADFPQVAKMPSNFNDE
jgi:hypothetical protein